MSAPIPMPSAVSTAPARRPAKDAPAAGDARQSHGFGRELDSARRREGDAPADTPASPPADAPAADASTQDGKPASAPARRKDDTSGKAGDRRSDADDTRPRNDGQSPVAALLAWLDATRQAWPPATGTNAVADAGVAGDSHAAAPAAAMPGSPLALSPGLAEATTGDGGDGSDGPAQAVDDDGAAATPARATDAVPPAPAAAIPPLAAIAHAMASHAAAGVAVAAAAHAGGRDPSAASQALAAAGLPDTTVAPGAASGTHALRLDAPAGGEAFARELGQQVLWLGGQSVKQATIRLHPAQLGSLDVKVSMSHDGRVDVSFAAQHPAAVTAVQQSLGQLDLMLAGQGLSLGQAQVGQQGAGRRDEAPSRGGAPADAEHPLEALAPAAARTIAMGLLDTFA